MTEARPGDLRLVVAPIDGKDQVILYMAKVMPGTRRQTNGPIYETGNGKIQFERLDTTTDPRIATVAVKNKPDGSGYTVEAKVALWWTGLNLYPGARLRLDASVQLSNPAGTKTVTRIPWHSTDASDMATDDVYYESLLRPQNWGEARVEN